MHIICSVVHGGDEEKGEEMEEWKGCYHVFPYFEWGRGRDGICHSCHSRREGKIFASGVNFSRNNAVCYINESKKLHYTLISSQKLLTYY